MAGNYNDLNKDSWKYTHPSFFVFPWTLRLHILRGFEYWCQKLNFLSSHYLITKMHQSLSYFQGCIDPFMVLDKRKLLGSIPKMLYLISSSFSLDILEPTYTLLLRSDIICFCNFETGKMANIIACAFQNEDRSSLFRKCKWERMIREFIKALRLYVIHLSSCFPLFYSVKPCKDFIFKIKFSSDILFPNFNLIFTSWIYIYDIE